MRNKPVSFLLLGLIAINASVTSAQAPVPVRADCPRTVLAIAEPVTPARRFEKSLSDQRPAPGSVAERDVCRMTVDTFQSKRANLVVADTRPRGERLRIGVPGALALDVIDIKQKSFLQDADLVLVGSGLDDAALIESCTELRRNGPARVSVLQGGVRAMFRNGLTLTADGNNLMKFDWLAPEELHRFAAQAPHRIVLFDIGAAMPTPASLATAQRLASDGDIAANAARLQKLAQGAPDALLAVVTASSATAQALHQAFRAAPAHNIFIVHGGLPAYTSYLATQQGIAAHANLSLIRPCGAS